MNSPLKQARPLSKRALAARLKAQRREDAVIARQMPELSAQGYVHYLRTGGY